MAAPTNGTANRWGSEKTSPSMSPSPPARTDARRFQSRNDARDDTFVSLEERVAFANRFPKAVFVSIHFNSAPGGVGIESYALAPEGVTLKHVDGEHHVSEAGVARHAGNAQDEHNIALTASIHAMVLSRLALSIAG